MKFLKDLHENAAPLFEKGGKLEKLYPLWEAHVHGRSSRRVKSRRRRPTCETASTSSE